MRKAKTQKINHWMEMSLRQEMIPAAQADESTEPETITILFSNTDNVQK